MRQVEQANKSDSVNIKGTKKKSTIQAQGNMYTKIESHCETILILDEFCNICSSIYYAILKNGQREKTNLHSSIDGINKENQIILQYQTCTLTLCNGKKLSTKLTNWQLANVPVATTHTQIGDGRILVSQYTTC